MTKSGCKKEFRFKFPADGSDIKKICLKNKEKIIQRLLEEDIYSASYDSLTGTKLKTSSKLTYLPHRFDIIIKNGYVYFFEKGGE